MTPREGKTLRDEPVITVNGVRLTYGQAMTLRVALTSFHSSMVTEGLGDDDTGKAIADAYIKRSQEILKLMGVIP